MARWSIVRSYGGTKVYYDNLVTQTRYDVGVVESFVSDEAILDWILTKGRPGFGDEIVTSGGDKFYYQPVAVRDSMVN